MAKIFESCEVEKFVLLEIQLMLQHLRVKPSWRLQDRLFH